MNYLSIGIPMFLNLMACGVSMRSFFIFRKSERESRLAYKDLMKIRQDFLDSAKKLTTCKKCGEINWQSSEKNQ